MSILPLFGLFIPLLFLGALVYFLYYSIHKHPDDTIEYPKPLLASIILAIFALNVFAYKAGYGFGLGAFFLLLFISILYSTKASERTWLHYTLAVTGSFAAMCFAWRANEFVQGINVFVVVSMLAAMLMLHATKRVDFYVGWVLNAVAQYVLRSLRQIQVLIRSLFSTKIKKNANILTAIKTIILTIVVVVFFGALLAEADAVFAHMVKDLIDQLFGRTVLSVLLAIAMVVTLSMRLPLKAGEPAKLKFLHMAEATVPLVALVAVFGVFLAIQYKYLYGSHSDFAALNITYSDYVRKGFTELLVVALFGGALTYIIALKRHALGGTTQGKVLAALNAVLLVQLGFVLLSAFKRNMMYVEMYGVTRIRIIGLIFLVWLAIFVAQLLWFALRKNTKESFVLIGTLCTSIAALVAFNIINIDAKIANATPPRNEPMDYFYIAALSTDAVDGWQKVVDSSKQDFNILRLKRTFTPEDRSKLATIKLAMVLLLAEQKEVHLQKLGTSGWKNYNYSTTKANKFFAANTASMQCVFKEIIDLQIERSVDLHDQENRRLYDYEYPFVSVNTNYYYPATLEALQSSEYNYYSDNLISGVQNKKAEECL